MKMPPSGGIMCQFVNWIPAGFFVDLQTCCNSELLVMPRIPAGFFVVLHA